MGTRAQCTKAIASRWRGAERAHQLPRMAEEARTSTINACSVANTATRLLLLLLWVFFALTADIFGLNWPAFGSLAPRDRHDDCADAVHRGALVLRPISLAAIKCPFLCTARTLPRTTMSSGGGARSRTHFFCAANCAVSAPVRFPARSILLWPECSAPRIADVARHACERDGATPRALARHPVRVCCSYGNRCSHRNVARTVCGSIGARICERTAVA